jgi:hypothetical protein
MIKIGLRILIILVVFAAVAGGIYLIVQNSGTTLFANTQVQGGIQDGVGTKPEGGTFDQGQPPSDASGLQPPANGQPPADGQRPTGGEFDRGGEKGGFSTRGLSELGINVGKIALITIAVLLIRGLINLI